ncbi:MAG: TonB family protein [Sediminimonas qiaohouensis]|uniref:TonB family protein n=1 Tax=Sediminimonas qiaohouensis TaxID=552061 RepID=A0A7C9HLL2_9RHOB|nr:TonB family protein [Sediminimonas qiaohouensis]MTJ04488.1 TonB family protein [Sediminimonas qiaohouensis]
MIRGVEFISCLCVAAAAHVGLWVLSPGSGVTSSGAQGAALTSLEASNDSIAQMVAVWERPPEVAEALDAPEAAEPDSRMAALPQVSDAPHRGKSPAQPDATERATPPLPDTASAPPMPLPVPDALAKMTTLSAPPQSPDVAPPVPTASPDTPERAEAPRPTAPAPRAQAPKIDTASAAPPTPRAAPERSARPKQRPEPPKPVQKASVDSRAAPAQQAAGTGGKTARGKQGKADVSTGDTAARRAQLAHWGAGIRRSIERGKRYPRGARQSGTVTVHLTVSRSGALSAVRVAASSGVAALDAAAVAAVRRARLPAAPEALSLSGYEFSLPITFRR